MNRIRKILQDNASVLVVIAVIAVARGSLADHYVVPTGSMEPTLMPGDRVFVDKTAFGWRLPFTRIELGGDSPPNRGDVVIFDSPEDGSRLVKRVAAVPGDRVAVQGGRLIINGEALSEPGQPTLEQWDRGPVSLNLARGGGPDLSPREVPPNRFLMLGDARGNSRDGRFFGWVEQQAIYARAKGVFWRRGERFVWKPL